MFEAGEVVRVLSELDVTHVVWVPDSTLGRWEAALDASPITLVRVCREGEAWTIAAGLYLGGARPLVMLQCTGLFESGDALRNVLYDYRLPLYALIGHRNALNADSADTAKRFTEPILDAWGVDRIVLDPETGLERLAEHVRSCRANGEAGVALMPERGG